MIAIFEISVSQNKNCLVYQVIQKNKRQIHLNSTRLIATLLNYHKLYCKGKKEFYENQAISSLFFLNTNQD